MSYTEHKLAGDAEIVEAGMHLMAPKLNVLDMFSTFAPERFYGQAGDKITVRVPGALPAREYAWRNDRSEPIKTDTYEETTVDITVAPPTNDYSAVKLSDEQKKFDLGGDFGRLTDAQTSAVANKINFRARQELINAPYELAIAADVTRKAVLEAMEVNEDVWFNAFIDAGAELDKLGVPFTGRSALVGAAVAAQIQKSQKLLKIEGTNSDSVFAQANIGNYAGFTIIRDTANLVPADEALVFDRSGFQFWSYAPDIPQGAVRGGRTNVTGVGMRFLVDYDAGYQLDRATWNSWTGFNYARDFVQGHDTDQQLVRGTTPYFVRGVKLIFKDGTGGFTPGDGGSADNGRQGASATSELSRYYKGEPLKVAATPAGSWYPNVLAGSVGIEGAEAPVAP